MGDERQIALFGRGIAAAFVACVSLALAAAGPGPALRRFESSEPHMGTTFTVVVYAADAARAARASGAAFARVAGLDARLSDYRQTSEAMRLTREAVGRNVRVSGDLYRVLSLSLTMSRRTGGAFDATVGPLSHLWRRARRQSELPQPSDIEAARAASGSALVHLDEASRSVRLARAGMRLDFGGIAKGYAADRALDALRETGIRRALVVAGGDVAAGEPPPGERGWRVTIAPFDTTSPRATRSLIVAGAAVSTSGDAEQWVDLGGVRYSHIFDPRTGWPLTGRRQATVVARDATTSDMLATTLCVLGQDGLRLADRTPGAAAMIAVPDASGSVRWAFSRRWDAVRRDFSPGVQQSGAPRGHNVQPGLSSPLPNLIFDTGGLMRRFVLGVLLAAAAAASLTAAGEQNTLTAAETADGWKLLFDGKTTSGWRGWKQQSAPDGWKAVDGALTRVAKAGDLITIEQYASFDFAFDWRIAKNGNSGVFFHVAEGPDLPSTYTTGPEYQLIDNDGHPDARNGPDRHAGGNYALHAPTNGAPRPIGEWNTSRILVNGPHVEHWLNGVKVVDYELWSPDWKARVEKSKFKAMPRYGLEKTGHIALQDHGDEVAFRNLKIKVLNKPGS